MSGSRPYNNSGIGRFGNLAYRNGDVGAELSRVVNYAGVPGSVSKTSFWSKDELAAEKDILETAPESRFGAEAVDDSLVAGTLQEIEYCLDQIQGVDPAVIDELKQAVHDDVEQHFADKSIGERLKSAFKPATLAFPQRLNDYPTLKDVAESQLDMDGLERSDFAKSFIDNAIGQDTNYHGLIPGHVNKDGCAGELSDQYKTASVINRLYDAVTGHVDLDAKIDPAVTAQPQPSGPSL